MSLSNASQDTRPDARLSIKLVVAVIFAAVAARGLFLEYTDLIDPTESRYAVVAQEMVMSNDWLTPKLPMPEGVVPYLGKPPLHFWITALTYRIFGFDEWSSRLPSLFATLGIIAALWFFGRRYFGRERAITGCAIYLSAWVPFFLAGASVTDVTLTFCTTASLAALYMAISSDQPRRSLVHASAAFAALSFLTKGPVGLVLIWLPIAIWSGIRRDVSWMRRFPWAPALLTFFLISSPWFIASELANPGFSKYFFWNENVARYLFKDYGDRYGTGHVHWYGASWVMVAAAFFPWTLPFLWGTAMQWSKGKKLRAAPWSLAGTDKDMLFLWCWALSTPFFFTFVRQLHGMYLLPAIPPLSLLTAILFYEHASSKAMVRFQKLLRSEPVFIVAGLIVLLIGSLIDFDLQAVAVTAGILIAGVYTLRTLSRFGKTTGSELQYCTTTQCAASLVCLYLIGIATFTPAVNIRRSCEVALQMIARAENCHVHEGMHRVGVGTRNAFSHYWAAGAWENELAEEVKVSYVPPEKADASSICYYLFKAPNTDHVPADIKAHFDLLGKTGDWLMYAKKDRHESSDFALLERHGKRE